MLKKAGIQHLAKHLNPSSQIVMRADFNVPIRQGQVKDTNRIKGTIPSIQELLLHNPKSLVLLSHLGRPQAKKSEKFSLKPIVGILEQYLNRKVVFLEDCVGQSIVERVNRAQNEIFLCENVRFHIEQTGKVYDENKKKIAASPESIQQFRNQLSRLGDCFVNDAFGTAHRDNSSVVGLKHKYRVAGKLMEKQLKYLGGFLENPKKPVMVILGGGKVVDKIKLIKNMINFADEIIIGGGMKNPFLKEIFGLDLGSTIIHMPENPNALQQIIQYAKQKGCTLHFPRDYRAGRQMKAGTEVRVFNNKQKIPEGWQIFDMGPETAKLFDEVLKNADSIFWNGPLGVIELEEFKVGSVDLLHSIIKRTKQGATSIIGGGDSASLVNNLNLQDQVSYVSTGGGATLELLQGKVLPGIANLSNIDELI